MERVPALAGDDVDDAAERTAEFGLVAPGLDLDLVDELEGDALAAVAPIKFVMSVPST